MFKLAIIFAVAVCALGGNIPVYKAPATSYGAPAVSYGAPGYGGYGGGSVYFPRPIVRYYPGAYIKSSIQPGYLVYHRKDILGGYGGYGHGGSGEIGFGGVGIGHGGYSGGVGIGHGGFAKGGFGGDFSNEVGLIGGGGYSGGGVSFGGISKGIGHGGIGYGGVSKGGVGIGGGFSGEFGDVSNEIGFGGGSSYGRK